MGQYHITCWSLRCLPIACPTKKSSSVCCRCPWNEAVCKCVIRSRRCTVRSAHDTKTTPQRGASQLTYDRSSVSALPNVATVLRAHPRQAGRWGGRGSASLPQPPTSRRPSGRATDRVVSGQTEYGRLFHGAGGGIADLFVDPVKGARKEGGKRLHVMQICRTADTAGFRLEHSLCWPLCGTH